MVVLLPLCFLAAGRTGDGGTTNPSLQQGPAFGQALRRVWDDALARSDRAAKHGVTLSVLPAPGLNWPPAVAHLAPPNRDPAWPYSAGLGPSTPVGTSVPVASQAHWVDASQLPSDYDSRVAFPRCSAMRAIQNQGACAGCYSFATVGSLGDRICQVRICQLAAGK
jgi:hypothetical protein